MSEKSKVNRAKREAHEQKKANKVVTGIIIALIVLGLVFMAFLTSGM